MPFILASINLTLTPEIFLQFSYGNVTNFVILLALIPFLPFLLILLEYKTVLELENCHQENQVQNVTNRYRQIHHQSTNFIRTELGIENPLQLTFSILLLLFALSPTRISDGLQAIFDEIRDMNENATEISEMPFNLPSEVLLFISYGWTLFSAYSSYCKRISWTKANFSIGARCILFLYVTISLFLTISANIMFLTPSLGLFSILSHYQGELVPYDIITDRYGIWVFHGISVNTSTDLCYFSDVPPFPWSDLTRFDYTDKTNPIPPPITIYTYFSLETILCGFWIIWFVHIFVVWFVKVVSNPDSHKRQKWLEAFINAIENTQIPAPMFDWDDLPASIVPDYVQRQRLVDYEMGFTILANLCKHLFMMIPVWVFGKNCTKQKASINV